MMDFPANHVTRGYCMFLPTQTHQVFDSITLSCWLPFDDLLDFLQTALTKAQCFLSERKVHRKFTGWWFRRRLKVKQTRGKPRKNQPTGLWPMFIWIMLDLTHLSWVEIHVLVGQTWLDHGFFQISFNGSDFHIELRNPCYFVVLDNPIYCDGSLTAQHWFESLTWSNTT